jgi:hypothetical protein
MMGVRHQQQVQSFEGGCGASMEAVGLKEKVQVLMVGAVH